MAASTIGCAADVLQASVVRARRATRDVAPRAPPDRPGPCCTTVQEGSTWQGPRSCRGKTIRCGTCCRASRRRSTSRSRRRRHSVFGIPRTLVAVSRRSIDTIGSTCRGRFSHGVRTGTGAKLGVTPECAGRTGGRAVQLRDVRRRTHGGSAHRPRLHARGYRGLPLHNLCIGQRGTTASGVSVRTPDGVSRRAYSGRPGRLRWSKRTAPH